MEYAPEGVEQAPAIVSSRHIAPQSSIPAESEQKPEKRKLWNKIRNRHSQSHEPGHSESVGRLSHELQGVHEKEPKEEKQSRLRSAFGKIKRRSGATVLHKKNHQTQSQPARQDGDSTELEDSSDVDSFHSTEEPDSSTYPTIPEPAAYATSTAENTPALLVSGTPEEGQTPVAKPVSVPGDELMEGETAWSEKRGDRLSGLHLGTKFKEDL